MVKLNSIHPVYQGCMWSGVLESNAVQLRKVVTNWAEQVEMGH
jgi:hypothetical protein